MIRASDVKAMCEGLSIEQVEELEQGQERLLQRRADANLDLAGAADRLWLIREYLAMRRAGDEG